MSFYVLRYIHVSLTSCTFSIFHPLSPHTLTPTLGKINKGRMAAWMISSGVSFQLNWDDDDDEKESVVSVNELVMRE